MFTIKRRLLAVAFIAALALAQVVPASAQQVSLDSSFCEGYGDTWVVYPTYIAGHTIKTAGVCHTDAYLYARVGTSWVLKDDDHNWTGNSYVSWYGASTLSQGLHVLRTNDGLNDGVTAYSYGW